VTPEPAGVFQPAIGPAGDAVIAWMTGDFVVGKHVQARTLAADGALGPVLDIPTPGQGTGVPGVAVGAGGEVVVAWDDQGCRCRQADGESGHLRRLLVRSATPAGGRVGEIAEAWNATRPGRGERAIHPSVLVDGGGDALVSWAYSLDNGVGGDFVRARRFSAGGALGATITAPIGDTAMAPSGRAATIWWHDGVLRARTISPSGRIGPQVVLGTIDDDAAATVAMSPAGTAVIAWERERYVVTRSLSRRGRLSAIVRLAHDDDVVNPRIPSFQDFAVAAGPANVVAWQRQGRWMPEATVDSTPARPPPETVR